MSPISDLSNSPWVEEGAVDFDKQMIREPMIHIQIADCNWSGVQALQSFDRGIDSEIDACE